MRFIVLVLIMIAFITSITFSLNKRYNEFNDGKINTIYESLLFCYLIKDFEYQTVYKKINYNKIDKAYLGIVKNCHLINQIIDYDKFFKELSKYID